MTNRDRAELEVVRLTLRRLVSARAQGGLSADQRLELERLCDRELELTSHGPGRTYRPRRRRVRPR